MLPSKTVSILLVDDREDNLLSLNILLRSPEYLLVNASSGEQALECLAERDFAAVLLDVQMPGMDGLETARRVRRMDRARNTPIIFVTGLMPSEDHIRLGYDVGAVDFVSKPFDPRILKSKIAVFAELFRKTETIREQEKLLHEASESRFRTLFEQSPLAIRLYSPSGDCVEANGAWARMWGERAPVLQALNARQDPQAMPSGTAIVRALGGESSELPPSQFHGKWVKSFVYPVFSEQGKVREAAVIQQDVGEQLRAQEELRRSRDQLNVILERVTDGVVVHDRSVRPVYANDIAGKLLGFGSAAALLASGSSFKVPAAKYEILDEGGKLVDMDRVPTLLALRGEHPAPEILSRFRDRQTGQERWLIISSRPMLDEAGKPQLAVTFYREITEQKRVQERDRFLSKATAILASSLDYVYSLKEIADLAAGRIADWCKIGLLDESGNVQTVALSNVDPNLAPIAGYSIGPGYQLNPPGEKGSYEVLRTGKSVMIAEIRARDIADATADAAHYQRLEKLGMRSLMIVPIRARNRPLGTIALAYAASGRLYDASDLQLAEELGLRVGMAVENAQLYQEARAQRERLQKAVNARDEFISIASHELKTPVTSLILHAEMAALQLQRNEPAEEMRERMGKHLSISTSQIDRLSRLIEDMLDVSRISHGKLAMEFEVLDLVRVAQGVLDDFSGQLSGSGSRFEFKGVPEAWVRADRYRIEQVLTNLLTNATKYGQGKPIHVAVECSESAVMLIVRDQGIGIAPENHGRVFERFERAVSASTVSGLGLGLYIVKSIVEGHGGQVEVRSELGRGAEFVVTLERASRVEAV